ncbi:MAG: hypothetical protein SFX74_08165 [Fimbriimonadaceae bacterium]|nr:hypothetical protein [Fimbriimonadaceae bacterium]
MMIGMRAYAALVVVAAGAVLAGCAFRLGAAGAGFAAFGTMIGGLGTWGTYHAIGWLGRVPGTEDQVRARVMMFGILAAAKLPLLAAGFAAAQRAGGPAVNGYLVGIGLVYSATVGLGLVTVDQGSDRDA